MLIHMIYGRVVEEMPALPATALIAVAEVAEAIVNPAIETYCRAPITIIENESAAAPTPIARSPKVADFRSHHPCTRHPIILTIPSPMAWGPDITVARTNWLIVNGNFRRRDGDGYADLRKRRRRQDQH